MSNTHITVEKNGIQDEMNINVWEAIGADSNKDGWKRVATAPIEVVEMKRKVAEEPEKTEEVADPVGTTELKAKKKK